MKLVIGGYAQGKLNYVLQKYSIQSNLIWESELPDRKGPVDKTVIVNHFHEWMKKEIAKGRCPEEEILSFVETYPNLIILSDEIGNGIVPVDAFEREYRERTGRILIELAKRAEGVERVICGIGQKIK